MSAWGIYCDFCGAPDCMCSCLEELRASRPRRATLEAEDKVPKKREIEIGDNLGCLLALLVLCLTFLGTCAVMR